MISVSEPAAFVAVNVTEYVPGLLYTTVGLNAVELGGNAPGIVHWKLVAFKLLKFSKKTACGAQPFTGDAAKLATGGVTISTSFVISTVPQAFVTKSVTR